MNKSIAILRGINVGGKRRVLMADLKLLFENLGFFNIETYIQSGNVIFDTVSKLTNIEISDTIEKSILDKYGFIVPVIIRSVTELQQTINNNPFYQEKNTEITQLHLTFLKDKPLKENLLKIETYNSYKDEFFIAGKEVYVFCEEKYSQSKFTNNFFENKLKVSATTRNWKTVLKLLELSNL